MNGYIIYFIGFIITTSIAYTLFHYDNNSSEFLIFSISVICGVVWFGFIPLFFLWFFCVGVKAAVDKIIIYIRGLL